LTGGCVWCAGGDAAVQAALRKLFPNSFMCGKCHFG